MSKVENSSLERARQQLKALSAKPLSFKPNFPEVAARWEAWWQFKSRSPLILLQAAKRSDIRWGKAFDLFDKPEEWLRVRRLQVESTHYAGDSLPSIRVDLGPVSVAAFLGAPLHLSESEQTSWQDPIINEWAHCPPLTLDPANRWWRKTLELARITARDAAGDYVICFPDLTGAIDTLSNMRMPERLCMDLFDNRQNVMDAAMKVTEVWYQIFTALHETVLSEGAGVMQWTGSWSSVPHTVPTCDFNALIGCDDFNEVCLPSLRRQFQLAGRAVLHLDGPAAARHAEALSGEESLTALQYTPGAGTPSALAKLDMFRMMQKAGKPVLISCPLDEVDALVEKLDPRGLALSPHGIITPQAADDIVRRVESRFSGAGN